MAIITIRPWKLQRPAGINSAIISSISIIPSSINTKQATKFVLLLVECKLKQTYFLILNLLNTLLLDAFRR